MLLIIPTPAARAQPQDRDEAHVPPAATEPAGGAEVGQVPDIAYEIETLDNGLKVIYAPMSNAPVVHVRVLYHVGSKDETPDRQGFAHMFEHMMFRGSEHVPSERHMELINGVGGMSNAFTSFDQTTYVNTVPTNALQMALWLEADRMGGFRVDEEKFVTERNVVNEEYLQRVVNPPYGRMFMDFFALAYDDHHYRWTPIGDMEQLRQAQPEELQQFFDTYYVPNNAVLTIAGEFDVDEAKQWVRDYYGWIPRGDEISRRSPSEPPQEQAKQDVVTAPNIPLARVILGYKTTTWADPDQETLEVLGAILGQGRSSRLYQSLVAGPDPIASQASAGSQRLEDIGMFLVSVTLLPGREPDEAQQRVLEAVRLVAEEGVTDEELAKARTQIRLTLLDQRQTATSVATVLAEAQAFGGDAKLVNEQVERLEKITPEDVRRVAKKYLDEHRLSVLKYVPGQAPAKERAGAKPPHRATSAAASTGPGTAGGQLRGAIDDAVGRMMISVEAFPPDYPRNPPLPGEVIDASFGMGESFKVGPVEVVVIHDDRLPLVGMTLLLPGGGDAQPEGKEGLATLTADLLTRGAGGKTAAEWSSALESRGIQLSVGDGGDHTRVSGSFPAEQLGSAAAFVDELLREPNLDENEFRNLKFRALAGLRQMLSDPSGVAGREMSAALFGDAPAGRAPTLESLADVTLDDVQEWFRAVYNPPSATLILAGDVSREQAESFAGELITELDPNDAVPLADYTLPAPERRVIVVDNKSGGQSAVRIGGRAFRIDSDEKFAGSVATEILSSGIESRLNRVLRAEKGLTYGASGRFNAGRHAGSFQVGFATRPETTGEAVRSTFEVLERMAGEPVTDEELAEAKRRVTGSLVMSTQTVSQLAGLRGNIALNDFPLDYYDHYADNIAAVSQEDVQEVMRRYASPDRLTIVVVGPASVVVPQLQGIADVEVVAMPLER